MPPRSTRAKRDAAEGAVDPVETPDGATVADTDTAPEEAPPAPRTTTRRKRGASRQRPAPALLLPVLVVPETLLLPHMSIPYPIEDEESAMVLDRASRMEPRQVLVLTERPVLVGGDGAVIEEDFRELLADAIGRADARRVCQEARPVARSRATMRPVLVAIRRRSPAGMAWRICSAAPGSGAGAALKLTTLPATIRTLPPIT